MKLGGAVVLGFIVLSGWTVGCNQVADEADTEVVGLRQAAAGGTGGGSGGFGGTSGAGGVAGVGGGGGGGGIVAGCRFDSECPAPLNPCTRAFCNTNTGQCQIVDNDGVECDD